ncbi:Uncharacterised protein [Legionella lansingensis]|uniref:Msp4/OMP-like domain-containing protein n=1 Tax=Legionella lansingensis TaxID=45067 RepID=A0A0W0VMN3_9GAMM|nr:P44/Msp2 family outer membrane protein [Legionella lansingensis]KTD21408.1 hypothetical protein Llan_1571 [Legionella lansingensis]SNV51926.1 Uncharacterised protein [Legionella lansingensis]
MKNFLKLGLPALLASSSAFCVGTPADGWYAGLFLVGSYVPTADFTLTPAQFFTLNFTSPSSIAIYNATLVPPATAVPFPTSPNGEIKYSFGGGVGGQAGYRWCGFRFEGELLFNYNTFKSLNIGGVTFGQQYVTTTVTTSAGTVTFFTNPYSMSGHTQLISGLFNVLYDFYRYDSDQVGWFPYLGAGIGYANVQNQWVLNINSFNAAGQFFTPVIRINDSESTPVGQAIVGLGYQMDDYFSVFADYRYLTSRQLKTTNDRLVFHTLNFGFNYWFNA